MFGNFEMNVALWAPWSAQQRHSGLLRSTVAFLDVALQTGSHNVFPIVRTTSGARHDVVNRQVVALLRAILARIRIPVQNVAPGQTNLFIRNLDVTS